MQGKDMWGIINFKRRLGYKIAMHGTFKVRTGDQRLSPKLGLALLDQRLDRPLFLNGSLEAEYLIV